MFIKAMLFGDINFLLVHPILSFISHLLCRRYVNEEYTHLKPLSAKT